MGDTSLVFNLVARDQASGEVSQFAERLNTAAATIGGAFALALGAGVMTNLDVTAAGDKLAAQLGIGPAEAAELSQVAATVYENAWGDSIETVNQAIRGVYQNIGDVSAAEGGLEGVTTKVLALAETFDQDLNTATAAVGQILKTGLADNADEAMDIVTRGFQAGVNKADDFLETLNEYGTQFRDLGLSGAQATGILQQGLKAGARDADIVADALKELNIRVKDGTADEGLKKMGLDADAMSDAFASGGPKATAALDQITDRLRGIKDPSDRARMAQALLGTQSEDLSQALYAIDPSSAVDALGKVEGAANKMTETVGDNPKAALESFKRKVMGDLGEAAGAFIKFATENRTVMEPLAYTLAGLAALVLVVKGAMMVYAAVSTVVTAAHAIMSASAWTVIGNWSRMMAIGLMAYARIAASAVVSAATTAAAWVGSALVSIGTWVAAVVRAAVTAVAQFTLMAARAVVWAATMAAQWLIAMGPIGWVIALVVGLVALIILNWDRIKEFTGKAWDWIWGKIKGIGTVILNFISNMPLVRWFLQHWDRIKSGTISKVAGFIGFVRGLPGKIASGIGNLGSLLFNKGMDVVRGLWNGIKSMGGWLKSQLMSFARNLVPGPIAKALGIASPSKVMADVVGRWIPAGIVDGIEQGSPALDRTMSTLVTPPSSSAAATVGRRMAPVLGGAGAGGGVTVLEIRSSGSPEDDYLLERLRKSIRVRGGNVQLVLGNGSG